MNEIMSDSGKCYENNENKTVWQEAVLGMGVGEGGALKLIIKEDTWTKTEMTIRCQPGKDLTYLAPILQKHSFNLHSPVVTGEETEASRAEMLAHKMAGRLSKPILSVFKDLALSFTAAFLCHFTARWLRNSLQSLKHHLRLTHLVRDPNVY